MIKVAFLAALVCLTVGAAYAGPSAPLSITVVPAKLPNNTCAPFGTQATNDVAAAGFNTCALYSDWTAPTGAGWQPPFQGAVTTTSNWLDCSFSQTDTTHIWHYGIADRTSPGGQQFAPCATHIVVTTDPVTGKQALAERSIYGDLVEGAISSGYNTIQTANYGGQAPASGFFPLNYQEVTFRFDAVPTFLEAGLWQSQPFTAPWMERDSWICGSFAGQDCLSQGSLWDNLGHYAGNWISGRAPFSTMDPTTYHTWGVLWTGDGNGNYSACTYLDGTRIACHLDNQPPGGTNNATAVREMFRLEYAIYNGPCGMDGHYTCLPNYGVQNMYIKNVKVLSCSNFASSTEMCHGTHLDATGNFYQ